MHPALEYACPVWYLSLTVSQYKALESLQKWDMQVSFNYDDYLTSFIISDTYNFKSRSEHLAEQFLRHNVSMKNHLCTTSCLLSVT